MRREPLPRQLAALADRPIDGDLVRGVVILEVLCLLPAIDAWLRSRRLKRLLQRIDQADDDEVAAEAAEYRSIDESLHRIGRLVATLHRGPLRDTGAHALLTAEEATASRRTVLRRKLEMEHLLPVTKSPRARRRLKEAIDGCEAELVQSSEVIDELAAAVSDLAEEAEDDRLGAALDRVRDAIDRVDALELSLVEVRALDPMSAPTAPSASGALKPPRAGR